MSPKGPCATDLVPGWHLQEVEPGRKSIEGGYETQFLLTLFCFLVMTWPGSLVFLLLFCSTGVWTQGLHLEPLHQPFSVMGFFRIGSHELFCLVWLQTMILLISATCVTRTTGVSHQHLAEMSSLAATCVPTDGLPCHRPKAMWLTELGMETPYLWAKTNL
jgi:hypothetical protein